jgi:predicted transcriptional regulator
MRDRILQLTRVALQANATPARSDGFPQPIALRLGRMSTKEILLEVAKKLPAEASLADAISELEFRQAVEAGLASLDRGERVPLEQARKRIPQWISQYSSRKTR